MEGGRIFSVQSDDYASSRPHYPAELFAWIAAQCMAWEAAWDCATGNGQAALGLAQHFDWVEATDFSPEQIEHAFAADNVCYSVQPAEQTDFPSASFDLVTVAQALPWFDFDAFWPEVRRTAKPTAFFCAWGYAWFDCDSELDAALFTPVLRILEPFWAGENAIMCAADRRGLPTCSRGEMTGPSAPARRDWPSALSFGIAIALWLQFRLSAQRICAGPRLLPPLAFGLQRRSLRPFRGASCGPVLSASLLQADGSALPVPGTWRPVPPHDSNALAKK